MQGVPGMRVLMFAVGMLAVGCVDNGAGSGRCETDRLAVYAAADGGEVEVLCKGPDGCQETVEPRTGGVAVACDLEAGLPGEACSREGMESCGSTTWMLTCEGGVLVRDWCPRGCQEGPGGVECGNPQNCRGELGSVVCDDE